MVMQCHRVSKGQLFVPLHSDLWLVVSCAFSVVHKLVCRDERSIIFRPGPFCMTHTVHVDFFFFFFPATALIIVFKTSLIT